MPASLRTTHRERPQTLGFWEPLSPLCNLSVLFVCKIWRFLSPSSPLSADVLHEWSLTVRSSGDKPCSVRAVSGGLGLALACRCPRCRRRRRNRFCIAAAFACACVCLVAPSLSDCGGGRGLSPICFGRRNRRRHQPTERGTFSRRRRRRRGSPRCRAARRDRLLGRSSSARRGESI